MTYMLSFFERYTSTDPELDRILKEQYNKGMNHGAVITFAALLGGAVIGRLVRYYVKKN